MIRSVKFELKSFNDKEMIKEGTRLFNWYIKRIKKLKTYSRIKIHKETYLEARKKFPLLKSSQIQSVRDHGCGVGKRFKLHKSSEKKIEKKTLSMAINNRCFSFKGTSIGYSTSNCMKEESIKVLDFQKEWIKGKVQGLVICFKKGRWWANVSFKHEPPEMKTSKKIIGIDLGIKNIATLNNGKIFDSKKLNQIRRKNAYKRKTLQSKGTSSAKKKLKVLSGKERRFTENVLHLLTKEIVKEKASHFVLEDLTNIRKQNKGKKFNRKGSWYKCSECGYQNHADVNASLNIQSLSTREGQASVNKPNVKVKLFQSSSPFASLLPCAVGS